jgi:pantothenate kinase type III
MRYLAAAVAKEHFATEQPVIVGTGGFGRLFEEERLFDAFVPELPLLGLRRAVELWQSETKR